MSEVPSLSPANQSDRSPKMGSAAFVCPHCKAFTQQSWFTTSADRADKPPGETSLADLDKAIANARAMEKRGEDPPFSIVSMQGYRAALVGGFPHVSKSSGHYVYWHVSNVNLSICFVCEKPAVWVAGRIRFPVTNAEVPEPNQDLPEDIRRDYVEAGEVVSGSARSAAALLRLAIQKLCSHLLERDGGINEMIGELVARGLSPMIQRALDVVRVVGNEAVHPGELDLRDDQVTAMQLFGLVNLIAEQMITQPKHVMALYGTLPPDKIAGIEQRDAKARRDTEPKA